MNSDFDKVLAKQRPTVSKSNLDVHERFTKEFAGQLDVAVRASLPGYWRPPPIMKSDFDKVLAKQRPTVSKSDLDVHERFTKEFVE
ncbi:hypothetical protein V2J09_002827 [Rumex salicifolius]